MEQIVTIILGVLTLVGNCGWLMQHRKYRQEVRKSQAEARHEELDLSADFVREFREQIYNPLAAELERLRSAVKQVTTCPHYPACPVLHQLQTGSGGRTEADVESRTDGLEVHPDDSNEMGGNGKTLNS